jgi:2-iminobutanoate/2-iminopropanoate deaminase
MSKIKILHILTLTICLLTIAWLVVLNSANASDKSKKKVVETADAPKPGAPYSQAIIADNLVFTAGQIGLNPQTGKLVEGGTEAEAVQVLKNLEAVLKAADSDFDNDNFSCRH